MDEILIYDRYEKLPEYYHGMYLDGYTPEQIILAAHRKAYKQYLQSQAEKEETMKVQITSEVKNEN